MDGRGRRSENVTTPLLAWDDCSSGPVGPGRIRTNATMDRLVLLLRQVGLAHRAQCHYESVAGVIRAMRLH